MNAHNNKQQNNIQGNFVLKNAKKIAAAEATISHLDQDLYGRSSTSTTADLTNHADDNKLRDKINGNSLNEKLNKMPSKTIPSIMLTTTNCKTKPLKTFQTKIRQNVAEYVAKKIQFNWVELGWVGLGWVCVPGMQQLLRQSRPQPGVCSNCWLRDTTVSTLLIVNILPPSPLCLPCLPCLLCALFSVSCVVSRRKHRRQENAAPCVVVSGRRRSSGGGRGDKEGEVGGVASAR
jgi:hypothetical protein